MQAKLQNYLTFGSWNLNGPAGGNLLAQPNHCEACAVDG
jgi:hypothetical protein